MERSEAQDYINDARQDRKDIAEPLHDPAILPEEKQKVLGNIRAWNELLHESPDYRQAMRVVSEIRAEREIKQPENQTKRIEYEFPTDPEKRYAAILSALANNAGKQITFLSIPSISGVVITPSELRNAFLENSGKIWKTSDTLQKAHVSKSLIPIGMVAEEVVFRSGVSEEVIGFTQTEAGRMYGDPVSKFLLRYASEHDVSLERILGTASSRTDSRAPYNRAQILEYLLGRKDGSGIRIVDIQKDTQLNVTVIAHTLRYLQEESLITFDSVNLEKTEGKFTYTPTSEFRVKNKIHLKTRRDPSSVLKAIEELQEQGITKFEIDSILSQIQKNNPAYKRKYARDILSELTRKGYLEHGEFKGSERMSTVTILQEGIDFINEALTPLRTALADTPEGEALRREWRMIPWSEYASKALEIHRENSRKANRTDPAVAMGRIMEVIAENPGIRTTEIKNKLKEFGLPYKNPRIFINSLIKEGRIRKEVEGRASRWYPVEENMDTKSISED